MLNELHVMVILFVVSIVAISAPVLLTKQFVCIDDIVYTKYNGEYRKLTTDNKSISCPK